MTKTKMIKFYNKDLIFSIATEIHKGKEYAVLGDDLMLLSDYEIMMNKQGFYVVS